MALLSLDFLLLLGEVLLDRDFDLDLERELDLELDFLRRYFEGGVLDRLRYLAGFCFGELDLDLKMKQRTCQ